MTEERLKEIERAFTLRADHDDLVFSVVGYIPELIAEIRRLQAIIDDAIENKATLGTSKYTPY